jgi:hypothetical protein
MLVLAGARVQRGPRSGLAGNRKDQGALRVILGESGGGHEANGLEQTQTHMHIHAVSQSQMGIWNAVFVKQVMRRPGQIWQMSFKVPICFQISQCRSGFYWFLPFESLNSSPQKCKFVVFSGCVFVF